MEKPLLWGVVAILGVILFSIVYTVNEAKKECRINNDCKTSQYCGSDFKCHDFPVVEKEVVKEITK